MEKHRIHELYLGIKRGPMIAYPRSFLKLLEFNVKAAILLNQICFWSDIMGKVSFYKKLDDWFDEVGLTIREVKACLKLLRAKGFVTTDRHRVKGAVVTFYTIDWVYLRSCVFEIESSGDEGYKKSITESNNLSESMKQTKSSNLIYSSEVKYSNAPPPFSFVSVTYSKKIPLNKD